MEVATSSIIETIREPFENMAMQIMIFMIIIAGSYIISFLILKAIRLPYKLAHLIASLITFFAMSKSFIYIFIESHI